MPISKTLDVLLVLIMLAGAAWTFGQKYQAEAVETEVTRLDRKIALERETIQLLEADWSLMNQPNRLEELAKVFEGDLRLRPTQPEQIVEPNELPAPPVQIIPEPVAHSSDKFAAVAGAKAR
ncbi:hypothetical protein [Aureimonas sp. AU12]|jgi:hypothetical protein|uniref:cell division protein FtsL n=1 Tax=Aureimonas sp. AU12 TaxID=1638161 RepID=UPI000A494AE4|nr:hypothetical protein [Aureimonas sp. AU12]